MLRESLDSDAPEELEVVSPRMEEFYRELVWQLDEFVHSKKPTPEGVAVIVKRVGRSFGIAAAEDVPLPRLNRAERESRKDAAWLAQQ